MAWPRMLTLLAITLPLSAAEAGAETPVPSRRASAAPRLARYAPADLREAGTAGWLSHVHLRKGAGLELRRAVDVGERELILGLKGPVMKHERLGLTFEVRF